ncbi:MAG: hypothetical protein ACKOET_16025, partial [Verrucomicrobiota bacterium]
SADSETGTCPVVITRTYTVTDDCGNSTDYEQTISVDDTTAPVALAASGLVVDLAVDPVLDAADLDAGSTDACAANGLTYEVSRDGVTYFATLTLSCADLGDRTIYLRVTDACGNSGSTSTTVTVGGGSCEDGSLVGAGGCAFDFPGCGNTNPTFRLIYTQDPQAPSGYRLNASNPGQFFYTVWVSGAPGSPVTLNLEIPYPFVTQGSVPIKLYGDFSGSAQTCVEVMKDLTFARDAAGARLYQITVPNNAVSPSGSPILQFNAAKTAQVITITGPLDSATGILAVRVHLDYGLKGTGGWVVNASGAGVNALGTNEGDGADIDNCETYRFRFTRNAGASYRNYIIDSSNDFKKVPGFAGIVSTSVDRGSQGRGGVKVEIWNASLTAKVAETTTDADGVYLISYAHKSKTADYVIRLPAFQQQQKVTVKANGFAYAPFIIQ